MIGSGASRVWPRAGLALELMLLGAVAVAGLLTAGTLIGLTAGTVRLIEPPTALRAGLLRISTSSFAYRPQAPGQ